MRYRDLLLLEAKYPSARSIRQFQRMQGWELSSSDDIADEIAMFHRLVVNGELTIYRRLDLDDLDELEIKGHESWAYDPRYAVAYGSSDDAPMVITAMIAATEVDWLSTLAVQSMGEREVRPKRDARLVVTEITIRGEPIAFPTGMTLLA